jgi:chorismate mutase
MKTTSEVATALKCDKSTVAKVAKRLSLGKMVGTAKVFTVAEVAELKREIKPSRGNPNFGKAD